MDYIIIMLAIGFIFFLFGIDPFASNNKHKNKNKDNRKYHYIEYFKEFKRYDNIDARQAVAVGSKHFYSISNITISKCKKTTGQMVCRWINTCDQNLHHITHLNCGVIVGKYLYCVNNPPFSKFKKNKKKKHKTKIVPENYVFEPMDDNKNFDRQDEEIDTIEIFNHKSLEHIATIKVKCNGMLRYGSLTWIDYYKGVWWGCFSFYGKNNKYTTLVNFKIDKKTRTIKILYRWKFSQNVLKEIYPYSCSGCSIKDDVFFCTTRNKKEIQALIFDKSKNNLKYVDTIDSDFTGEGISWDRYSKENILWGIDASILGPSVIATKHSQY